MRPSCPSCKYKYMAQWSSGLWFYFHKKHVGSTIQQNIHNQMTAKDNTHSAAGKGNSMRFKRGHWVSLSNTRFTLDAKAPQSMLIFYVPAGFRCPCWPFKLFTLDAVQCRARSSFSAICKRTCQENTLTMYCKQYKMHIRYDLNDLTVINDRISTPCFHSQLCLNRERARRANRQRQSSICYLNRAESNITCWLACTSGVTSQATADRRVNISLHFCIKCEPSVRSSGREIHSWGARTTKAWSPLVRSWDFGTISRALLEDLMQRSRS